MLLCLHDRLQAVVQEALDRLMAGRTVLVIAHRLSTGVLGGGGQEVSGQMHATPVFSCNAPPCPFPFLLSNHFDGCCFDHAGPHLPHALLQ